MDQTYVEARYEDGFSIKTIYSASLRMDLYCVLDI